MIPIVSIFNFSSFVICVLIAFKLYFSYRKEKRKKIGYFFKSFLFLSLFFALLATPKLLLTNLVVLGELFDLSLFFVCLALAYFVVIALETLGWQKLKQIYFWGLIVVAFSITIVNLWNLEPAVVHQQGQFVFFEEARDLAINIIIGLIISLAALSSALFFFIGGLRLEEKSLRLRAFIIGGGLVMMALAGAVNYIPGASAQIFITSIIAGIMAILGLLAILAGIDYKQSNI